MDSIERLRKPFVGLTIYSALVLLPLSGVDWAYGQPMSTPNDNSTQQHAEHTLDNVIELKPLKKSSG
jgi:hypothetical protein